MFSRLPRWYSAARHLGAVFCRPSFPAPSVASREELSAPGVPLDLSAVNRTGPTANGCRRCLPIRRLVTTAFTKRETAVRAANPFSEWTIGKGLWNPALKNTFSLSEGLLTAFHPGILLCSEGRQPLSRFLCFPALLQLMRSRDRLSWHHFVLNYMQTFAPLSRRMRVIGVNTTIQCVRICNKTTTFIARKQYTYLNSFHR